MDERMLFMRLLREEFGNLKSVARIKTVTIDTVDYSPNVATVLYATDPDDTDPPDPQDVAWLNSMCPIEGQTGYLANIEGHPVLIGIEDSEIWHDISLPAGYSTVAPYPAPAYRMDNQRRVWLRGGCNVTANNVAGTKFNFPAPYRPLAFTRPIAAPFSNGTAITGQLRYDIGTSGNMNTLAASPAGTVFVLFEGLSFDTRD